MLDPTIADLLFPSKVHIFLDTYKTTENIIVSCLECKWYDSRF